MTGSNELVLPALRGIMGDWVYYSCLMSLKDLSNRVSYAEEIHKNDSLSKMIQRQLKSGRSSEISEYLKSQPERFFNSLVVAVYGGDPSWYPISGIRSKSNNEALNSLDDNTIASIGLLELSGKENLFALDGQHRLAGIKKAIRDGLSQTPYDEVSVIFVAHKKSESGLRRTRRLFTTLNKTAKPVSKGDIIALDEDDVMAISVRWLIEETELFSGERIAFVATNNLPPKNEASLTTIGNLYDLLLSLFTNSESELKAKKEDLQRARPKDEDLKKYFNFSKRYFQLLRANFSELDEFFSATKTQPIVQKYRNKNGGSVLFRPLGLEIFTNVILTLNKKMSLKKAVEAASKLPRELNQEPFLGTLWDDKKKAIIRPNKVLLRNILLYMLDSSKLSSDELLEKYRTETGWDDISLPDKVS